MYINIRYAIYLSDSYRTKNNIILCNENCHYCIDVTIINFSLIHMFCIQLLFLLHQGSYSS